MLEQFFDTVQINQKYQFTICTVPVAAFPVFTLTGILECTAADLLIDQSCCTHTQTLLHINKHMP